MEKRWNIKPTDESRTQILHQDLKINKNICSILAQRGIDDYEAAKSFFRPSLEKLHSPWLMKDMDKAVSRIQEAFQGKEKILIFGDYDVDGTTAVASMFGFLSSFYETTLLEFYIPDRYKEGYGVSKLGIDYAHQENFSLIICLDCGIKSVELIEYANQLKIDFIICDHHLPGEKLPPAKAILNPKQIDCIYPYKELCGCGVGFKLMTALAETFKVQEEKLWEYLDLVATAIAADIVPMTGENRILAYYGLDKINKNALPGIKALIELSGTKYPLTISNVVFVIAPRVNAAGRMDDAKKAVQLFIESDSKKAKEYAEMLHIDNTDRKEKDKSITEEALEIIQLDESHAQKKSTVVYKEDWHKGVVGIVASRLIETHYKPTVVLTYSNGLATGSARSVTGFNLYEAIYECREFLLAYGGHFAAAGLSMLPENVNAFTRKFEEVVNNSIDPRLLIPEILIDAAIEFNEITEGFYNILTQMEPFGPENLRPVFISRAVKNTDFSKIVKEQHVRFVLNQNNYILTGIGFNLAYKFDVLLKNEFIDVVYSIDENEWNGTKTIQLKVIDFAAHNPNPQAYIYA